MSQFKEKIDRYTREVAVGDLPQVYRKILDSLSEIRRMIQKNHSDLVVGSLYPGYMDISFFALVSPELKARQLKLVLVYVHATGAFEGWLAGINRGVQKQYYSLLEGRDLGAWTLSSFGPGIDHLIKITLVEDPDFEALLLLVEKIDESLRLFHQESLLRLKEAEKDQGKTPGIQNEGGDHKGGRI